MHSTLFATTHHSLFISLLFNRSQDHFSPIASHHSLHTTHHSLHTTHLTPLTTHQSPLTFSLSRRLPGDITITNNSARIVGINKVPTTDCGTTVNATLARSLPTDLSRDRKASEADIMCFSADGIDRWVDRRDGRFRLFPVHCRPYRT